MFTGIYTTINLANIVISEVPQVSDIGFSDEEKAEVVAEAKCIRALCYFDLLRHFGEHWDDASPYGVPLLTESSGGDLANIRFENRATVGTVWAQIFSDLQDAESGLPDTDDKAFVSQGFAKGLLARYHLYRKEYAQAITKATEVINNSNYELAPSFSGVFVASTTSEDVFKLLFNELDGSRLARLTIGREEVLPKDVLIAKLRENPSDTRQDFIGQTTGAQQRILKYPDNAGSTDPAYIMRLAELYFIRAEATALSGGSLSSAVDDVNAIRTRAGLNPASVATQDEFIDLLLEEKYKELFAEGHRFFDLVRLGKHSEVLGIQDYQRIFPIPQRELLIEGNVMVQNPGY